MTKLNDLNSYGEGIERRLQLRTSPIAIKLLEKEGDIPEGTTRPKRDLGLHLGLCQAFAMSRREGKQVAMLKEDHWCYPPVIALGLAETPEFILEGNIDYPLRIADLEAAKRLARTSPRLELGKYAGVVSAPLKIANFELDLVVIYCNSAQLRCLLTAIKYKEGYRVTSTLEPGGACVQATVPTILSGECNVAVPCMGDRKIGLARDDEMIFSVPNSMLEDLMLGLRHLDETNSGYADTVPTMRPDYPLNKSYVKVGEMLGMEVYE